MNVATRQVDGVTVLDLSGLITLGEGSLTLRDAIRNALDSGAKALLLNMAGIGYIDSSGIGELVSGYVSAKSAGGELKLLNPAKKVLDLLTITRLNTVFDIRDDEATAVSAFS